MHTRDNRENCTPNLTPNPNPFLGKGYAPFFQGKFFPVHMPYHFILYHHRTRRKIGPICFVCKTSQLRSVSNWPMPPAILNNGTDLVKDIETRIRYSSVSKQTLDRVIRMPPPQKGWLPEPEPNSLSRWTGTLTYGIILYDFIRKVTC